MAAGKQKSLGLKQVCTATDFIDQRLSRRKTPEIYVVLDTPIIASLDATDPTRMDLDAFIEQVANVGYSGVLNYPTHFPLVGHERLLVREKAFSPLHTPLTRRTPG